MTHRTKTFWRLAICSAPVIVLPAIVAAQTTGATFSEREKAMLERIARLEQRLLEVEKKTGASAPEVSQQAPATGSAVSARSEVQPQMESTNPWLKDTTLNFYFDGYYSYNPSRPVGRINLLRAYDVSANNLSINQTGMIIERAPALSAGRRWGYRLDLMYGQATETLQGGAQNEPRPQVYRNLFQAYGTYVAPLGRGLSMDFGKWASALGPEGNYTKDQNSNPNWCRQWSNRPGISRGRSTTTTARSSVISFRCSTRDYQPYRLSQGCPPR
jgi:hypothetical protein